MCQIPCFIEEYMHNSIKKNEYVCLEDLEPLLVSNGGKYILSYRLQVQILECS